jgi:undecaprenyl-diphosphatase
MNIIELLRYILYGAVQGFFEVLPISSSGHVTFFQFVTNDDFVSNNFFLFVVNFGSLVAIVLFLRKMIWELLSNAYKDIIKKEDNPEYRKSTKYLKNIIIGIIPIGILGTILTAIDFDLTGHSLVIIGVGALLTATILYLSRKRTDMFTGTKVTRNKAWYIGFFQLFALIPGVSRLAVTATAGTHKELSYNTSLRFSLLMYIPISLGTIIVSIILSLNNFESFVDFDTSNIYNYVYYFISFLMSYIGTIIALKFIFIITQKGNFRTFYLYNIVFGIIALIIGLMQY